MTKKSNKQLEISSESGGESKPLSKGESEKDAKAEVVKEAESSSVGTVNPVDSGSESESKKILKDSANYGVIYGLEDGLEHGFRQGIRHGVKSGIESALINGTEEAVEDVLSEEFQPETPVANDRKKKLRKRIIFWLKITVALLVLGWITFKLNADWQEISKYHWKLQPGWIFFSGILYLIAFFPAAIFWYLSLTWLGQKPGFFRAINAFYASQLGKYLPGKAMVVIIRSAMVSGEKVKTSIAAVCVFYETLTMMATGAFIASMIIMIWFREHSFYSLLALGAMLVSGLPVLPPFFVRIIHILHIGRNDPNLTESLKSITWRKFLIGFSLMSILWGVFGISLWAAIHGLGVTSGDFLENMPRYISVTALAIVLGFAVPISPGGLGIREAVLSILLIPYFETILLMPENAAFGVKAETLALIVSLEQRIISIIAELTLCGIFFATTAVHAAINRNRS